MNRILGLPRAYCERLILQFFTGKRGPAARLAPAVLTSISGGTYDFALKAGFALRSAPRKRIGDSDIAQLPTHVDRDAGSASVCRGRP
jgi:hypothetical protein